MGIKGAGYLSRLFAPVLIDHDETEDVKLPAKSTRNKEVESERDRD